MSRFVKKVKKWTGRSEEPNAAIAHAPGQVVPAQQLAAPPLLKGPESYGLFLRYEPPGPGTAFQDDPFVNFIAIHGLNGHADKTWTNDNGTNWLRDLLPKSLPQCRVYTFGYSSEVVFSSSYGTVRDFASRLLASVQDEWEKWPKVDLVRIAMSWHSPSRVGPPSQHLRLDSGNTIYDLYLSQPWRNCLQASELISLSRSSGSCARTAVLTAVFLLPRLL
jgi:hypothetical protein